MSVGTNESERVRGQGKLIPYSHNCRLQALPGVTSASSRKNWVPAGSHGFRPSEHSRTLRSRSTIQSGILPGPYAGIAGMPPGMFNASKRSVISGKCRSLPLSLLTLKTPLAEHLVVHTCKKLSGSYWCEHHHRHQYYLWGARSNTRFESWPTRTTTQRHSLAKQALQISIILLLVLHLCVRRRLRTRAPQPRDGSLSVGGEGVYGTELAFDQETHGAHRHEATPIHVKDADQQWYLAGVGKLTSMCPSLPNQNSRR